MEKKKTDTTYRALFFEIFASTVFLGIKCKSGRNQVNTGLVRAELL